MTKLLKKGKIYMEIKIKFDIDKYLKNTTAEVPEYCYFDELTNVIHSLQIISINKLQNKTI